MDKIKIKKRNYCSFNAEYSVTRGVAANLRYNLLFLFLEVEATDESRATQVLCTF
jgi:hypothetical protein